MNKDKQIISILSTIVLGICIWFGYSLHYSFTIPDKDSFVVLDKIEKQSIESTGKYSSELVYVNYIEVLYENGDKTTIVIKNPIDAKKYEIGKKYITNEFHRDVPFSVSVGYCLFFMLIGFAIISFIASYIMYLFSDESE